MRASTQPPPEEEVLTLPEAAKWLRISERTLWDRLDEIPHFRVGKQIRILISELRRDAKERSVKQ